MPEPCPACLEGRCVLHEHGRDSNTFDLSAMFGPSPTMDLKKSTILWRQRAQDEAEERARLIREIEDEQRKNSF
jgi:hypothetical protein